MILVFINLNHVQGFLFGCFGVGLVVGGGGGGGGGWGVGVRNKDLSKSYDHSQITAKH